MTHVSTTLLVLWFSFKMLGRKLRQSTYPGGMSAILAPIGSERRLVETGLKGKSK